MTNGEMIRRASDAELARLLIRVTDGSWCKWQEKCYALLDTEEGIPPEWCEACMRDWLNRRFEEI